MINKYATLILILLVNSIVFAQHESQKYVPETDPLVQEKLEQWQDLKFGLLMHWGAYSQWGIVESWSICPEDYGWCERKKGNSPHNYSDYVKEYENLKTTFNPVEFDPGRWARAAANAGMRYMIFTTKHHDGFCMFDTKETDYKITDTGCPFHINPKSNVTKELFNAFRDEGLWVGPYFSKPDWNNKNYWNPYFPPQDRNVNYDPLEYPAKWEKYVQFTHNQIMELMTSYGKVDILWLDGGWVAKKSHEDIKEAYHEKSANTVSGFIKSGSVNQDIRMDELVDKARTKQPGLIVVDRAVQGKNQNYLTPENRVPEKELSYPWESCIIAGGGWSWIPDAKYMSGRDAIHILADIVAKGGNLLLNIAPGPKGRWHDEAYQLLEEFGRWMKINSEAIYGTRAIFPYKEDNICLTKKPDGTIYAIYLAKENETKMPSVLTLSSINTKEISKITLLGSDQKLTGEKKDEVLRIKIPEKMQNSPPCEHAWVFKIETGSN